MSVKLLSFNEQHNKSLMRFTFIQLLMRNSSLLKKKKSTLLSVIYSHGFLLCSESAVREAVCYGKKFRGASHEWFQGHIMGIQRIFSDGEKTYSLGWWEWAEGKYCSEIKVEVVTCGLGSHQWCLQSPNGSYRNSFFGKFSLRTNEVNLEGSADIICRLW